MKSKVKRIHVMQMHLRIFEDGDVKYILNKFFINILISRIRVRIELFSRYI